MFEGKISFTGAQGSTGKGGDATVSGLRMATFTPGAERAGLEFANVLPSDEGVELTLVARQFDGQELGNLHVEFQAHQDWDQPAWTMVLHGQSSQEPEMRYHSECTRMLTFAPVGDRAEQLRTERANLLERLERINAELGDED